MTFLGRLASALFRHSSDGVLITDADGAIVRANPAACRMLGYSEAELCSPELGGISAADARLKLSLLHWEQDGVGHGHLECVRADRSLCSPQCKSIVIEFGDGRRWRVIVFGMPEELPETHPVTVAVLPRESVRSRRVGP